MGGVTYTVTDVPDKERFEAHDADGGLAGLLTYQATGPIVVFTHTSSDDEAVNDALARAAMEDARAKSRTVVPMAPFVSGWLDKHREYDKLVARSTKKIK